MALPGGKTGKLLSGFPMTAEEKNYLRSIFVLSNQLRGSVLDDKSFVGLGNRQVVGELSQGL